MTTLFDQDELRQQNKHLAPIFAKWMHALMECSDEVQSVVIDMLSIIADPHAEEHEREMAFATFQEALFPVSHNGSLGADLEELEAAADDT